jgi:hypothetical protein
MVLFTCKTEFQLESTETPRPERNIHQMWNGGSGGRQGMLFHREIFTRTTQRMAQGKNKFDYIQAAYVLLKK